MQNLQNTEERFDDADGGEAHSELNVQYRTIQTTNLEEARACHLDRVYPEVFRHVSSSHSGAVDLVELAEACLSLFLRFSRVRVPELMQVFHQYCCYDFYSNIKTKLKLKVSGTRENRH